MNTSSVQHDLINEELKRTGNNFSKVARELGLDYFSLKTHFEKPALTFRPALGPEPTDIISLGREGFQQYVIAIKRAGSGWPQQYDEVIADARKKYDDGTHEMFQTNTKGWVVQYLIPRMTPAPKRTFFSTMVVMS